MKKSKKGNFNCRKLMVAVRRFWSILTRVFWLGLFAYIFSCVAYILIACVTMYLETGYKFNLSQPVQSWESVKLWYKSCGTDTKGYIPTIVVASASLLLTMTTLAQSYNSRGQDKANALPNNYVDGISIGMDLVSNIRLVRKYFKPIHANMILEFSFKEGFSTYYKAYPYRMFINLKKISADDCDDWEELKIYNFQYSNLDDSNSNDYEVLIETSDSNLLVKYCNLPKDNEVFCLKIILDIRWTNNLMPRLQRTYSDIYMREEIKLSRRKQQDDDINFRKMDFYSYKVLFTEHMRAPFASPLYSWKCIKTILKQKKLIKKQQKTSDTLMKRKEMKKNG